MQVDDGLLDAVVKALELEGVDLAALGLAWARVAPTIAIVPAFGLRALPAPARGVMALVLAASIAPSIRPIASTSPWLVAMLAESARGIPLALATAVPLWAATMAGGAIDALRGANEGPSLPVVDGKATPLAGVFAMVASLAFLSSGGPSRVALAAMDTGGAGIEPLARAAVALSSGVGVAIAIAAPLLAASVVIEVALALLGRAASPTNVQSVLALGRGVAVLAIVALLFDRIAGALMLLGARA